MSDLYDPPEATTLPTIEEQETIQDQKILNLFDNTENLNANFHEELTVIVTMD